ncbi:ferredoxin [Halopenitus sp. POP-27]|uniref:ferredoxin n=1 Tax=Halopenitus sp. POP-27 TaxID=2994425 RepID=UPI0024687D58|nr:ferredoxin [Halopenitus sp. POP-27]
MKVVFDRDTCIGMYQCVEEWNRFEENMDDGKADLVGGDAVADDDERAGEMGAAQEAIESGEVLEVTVPEGEEFDAEMSARVCPVDAIAVYDDDGERIV